MVSHCIHAWRRSHGAGFCLPLQEHQDQNPVPDFCRSSDCRQYRCRCRSVLPGASCRPYLTVPWYRNVNSGRHEHHLRGCPAKETGNLHGNYGRYDDHRACLECHFSRCHSLLLRLENAADCLCGSRHYLLPLCRIHLRRHCKTHPSEAGCSLHDSDWSCVNRYPLRNLYRIHRKRCHLRNHRSSWYPLSDSFLTPSEQNRTPVNRPASAVHQTVCGRGYHQHAFPDCHLCDEHRHANLSAVCTRRSGDFRLPYPLPGHSALLHYLGCCRQSL